MIFLRSLESVLRTWAVKALRWAPAAEDWGNWKIRIVLVQPAGALGKVLAMAESRLAQAAVGQAVAALECMLVRAETVRVVGANGLPRVAGPVVAMAPVRLVQAVAVRVAVAER